MRKNPRLALADAAALGVVAGMRSMIPMAALAFRLGKGRRVPEWLQARAVRLPLLLGAAAELVYDKLPNAGSRLAAPSLAARSSAGGLAGAVVAHAFGGSRALGAVVGVGAALVSTLFFHRLRSVVDRRAKVPDVVSAIAEDALAFGLSTRVGRSFN
jgi:uncharacterized membrane protein